MKGSRKAGALRSAQQRNKKYSEWLALGMGQATAWSPQQGRRWGDGQAAIAWAGVQRAGK